MVRLPVQSFLDRKIDSLVSTDEKIVKFIACSLITFYAEPNQKYHSIIRP